MAKFFVKDRELLDAKDASIKTIFIHSLVNFLYGCTSGIVIAFVSIFLTDVGPKSAIYLFLVYFVHKQIESKILNRNKYSTKLGRNYIFPIPSTIGFVLGVYLSTFIS